MRKHFFFIFILNFFINLKTIIKTLRNMNRLQEVAKAFPPQTFYGVCYVSGDSNFSGWITLKKTHETCEIKGKLTNLPKGKHILYIAEYGCLDQNFQKINAETGESKTQEKYFIDLGSVTSNGELETNFEKNEPLVALNGDFSVLGRSIVINDEREALKENECFNKIGIGIIGVSDKF